MDNISKYLKIIYNNISYELGNNIYEKLIYSTLSVEYIYKYIYCKIGLNNINNYNYDEYDEYRDRNILIPFVSYIYEKNNKIYYGKCGFYDSNGLYNVYISGKTNHNIKNVEDIYNTCLNDDNSIANFIYPDRLIKVNSCPKKSHYNGHTEQFMLDDLNDFIENYFIYKNIDPLYIIVDIISTHHICHLCTNYLNDYAKSKGNVIFRVITGENVNKSKSMENLYHVNDIIKNNIIPTTNYIHMKPDLIAKITNNFSNHELNFYQEQNYNELIKSPLTKYLIYSPHYNIILNIIKQRFPLDYCFINTKCLVEEILHETDLTIVKNKVNSHIELLYKLLNNNCDDYNINLYYTVFNILDINKPSEWIKIYIGKLLLILTEKLINSNKIKRNNRELFNYFEEIISYLHTFITYGVIYTDKIEDKIDSNSINIENYKKYIELLKNIKNKINETINALNIL